MSSRNAWEKNELIKQIKKSDDDNDDNDDDDEKNIIATKMDEGEKKSFIFVSTNRFRDMRRNIE